MRPPVRVLSVLFLLLLAGAAAWLSVASPGKSASQASRLERIQPAGGQRDTAFTARIDRLTRLTRTDTAARMAVADSLDSLAADMNVVIRRGQVALRDTLPTSTAAELRVRGVRGGRTLPSLIDTLRAVAGEIEGGAGPAEPAGVPGAGDTTAVANGDSGAAPSGALVPYAGGALLLCVLLSLLVKDPPPLGKLGLRLVMALAAGIIGLEIGGTLAVELSIAEGTAKGTGGLGLFLLTYFVNPASLKPASSGVSTEPSSS